MSSLRVASGQVDCYFDYCSRLQGIASDFDSVTLGFSSPIKSTGLIKIDERKLARQHEHWAYSSSNWSHYQMTQSSDHDDQLIADYSGYCSDFSHAAP